MPGFCWPSFLVTALLSCHSPLHTVERTTTNFFFSSHFHAFFPSLSLAIIDFICRSLCRSFKYRPLRNKITIGIRVEFYNLLRLRIRNKHETWDRFSLHKFNSQRIAIIFAQFWIIRILVWYVVSAAWESRLILIKIYVISIKKIEHEIKPIQSIR